MDINSENKDKLELIEIYIFKVCLNNFQITNHDQPKWKQMPVIRKWFQLAFLHKT